MCYIIVLVQMVNANCILRRRQAVLAPRGTHVGLPFPLDLTVAGHSLLLSSQPATVIFYSFRVVTASVHSIQLVSS